MITFQIAIVSLLLFIAFVLSAIKYKKAEPAALRLLMWILLVSFITQLGAYYYSKYTHKSNHFIFNIQMLPVYDGYVFMYYRVLQQKWFKFTAMALTIAFVLFYLLRMLVFGSLFIFDSKVITLGELATLCCCMLYLWELLKIRHKINLYAMPMFWVTAGIMAAVIGDFLYIAAFDYILANNLDPTGNIMGTITTSISVVEYTCFSIAFLKVGQPVPQVQ